MARPSTGGLNPKTPRPLVSLGCIAFFSSNNNARWLKCMISTGFSPLVSSSSCCPSGASVPMYVLIFGPSLHSRDYGVQYCTHHCPVGFATWLIICTALGFPVSTTQSIVGALVGVGIASDISVNWEWKKGNVSQITASWGIAPCNAAGFGAIIFMSIKLLVHSRSDPMKRALRLLPFYYALTAGILALFIVIRGGHGIPTLEQMGAGEAIGSILGVVAGVLIISTVFFLPYYHAK